MHSDNSQPNSDGLSTALGWIADELRTLRNVHFLLLILSCFSIGTLVSIEPPNSKLQLQFLALRDQMGISGRVWWSGEGFYDWVFKDQLAEYPLAGNYAEEFKGFARFEPDDSKFEGRRPADDTFAATLNYLESLSVKGTVQYEADVSPTDLAELDEWKASAEEKRKTYNGDFKRAFFPFKQALIPNDGIRCFETTNGKCKEILGDRQIPDVLRNLSNSPENDFFILHVTFKKKSVTFSVSPTFLKRNASELLKLLRENKELDDKRWNEVGDYIFMPNLSSLSKLTLPILNIDVKPIYFLPALIVLLTVTQLYLAGETYALSNYARYVAEKWPHRPLFFSPWIGARPNMESIIITLITGVVIPFASLLLLLLEYSRDVFGKLPTGSTLEELESQSQGDIMGSLVVTLIVAAVILPFCLMAIYEAREIRRLCIVS